jgi:hypothetical protein
MAEDNSKLIKSLLETKNEANNLLNIERARHAEAVRVENLRHEDAVRTDDALFETNCAEIQTVLDFVDKRVADLVPKESLS